MYSVVFLQRIDFYQIAVYYLILVVSSDTQFMFSYQPFCPCGQDPTTDPLFETLTTAKHQLTHPRDSSRRKKISVAAFANMMSTLDRHDKENAHNRHNNLTLTHTPSYENAQSNHARLLARSHQQHFSSQNKGLSMEIRKPNNGVLAVPTSDIAPHTPRPNYVGKAVSVFEPTPTVLPRVSVRENVQVPFMGPPRQPPTNSMIKILPTHSQNNLSVIKKLELGNNKREMFKEVKYIESQPMTARDHGSEAKAQGNTNSKVSPSSHSFRLKEAESLYLDSLSESESESEQQRISYKIDFCQRDSHGFAQSVITEDWEESSLVSLVKGYPLRMCFREEEDAPILQQDSFKRKSR